MRFLFDDESMVDGRLAASCGVVYGSACFFLKAGSTSSSLSGWCAGNAVWDGSAKVMLHAVARMPHLRAVVCLGLDALKLAVGAGTKTVPPDRLDLCLERRFGDDVPVYAVPHPSRGSNQLHQRAWSFVRKDTSLDWIGRTRPDRSAAPSGRESGVDAAIV